MQKIGNLMPLFLDANGALMTGGKIYLGVADADPIAEPINAFWAAALTIPADQPLRTIGGYIVNETTPASVFVAEDDYCQLVLDYNGTMVFYAPSVFTNTDSFQPLDADLTAISGLATTTFGRNLLTLPNTAALATATGIPAPLPLVGGTVTGNITRSGAGVHAYFYDAAITGGRIFLINSGDPVPAAANQPGDLVYTLA